MVIRKQIGNGPADVPQEAIRFLLIAHNPADHGGPVGRQIIPATGAELPVKTGRPVLGFHFPTIELGAIDATARLGYRIQKRLHICVPVNIQRLPA